MMLTEAKKQLKKQGSKEKAKILKRFFKTGPGEYGETDKFLGAKVPSVRRIAKQHKDLSVKETTLLLRSEIHEERLLGLLIFISKFNKANDPDKKKIYELYLKNTKYVNNWDLVDLSAQHIVGAFLLNKSKTPLYKLAKSKTLWERRISILSTFHYIKNHRFNDTLRIAKILLADSEDLIHKAVGWMLREVGKRDLSSEEHFLNKYYKKMPRTMLRYAIERFPEAKRRAYLSGVK